MCLCLHNPLLLQLGEGVGVIEISGKAAPAEFKSKPAGYEPNNYLIEWTVLSHSTVNKFELLYR